MKTLLLLSLAYYTIHALPVSQYEQQLKEEEEYRWPNIISQPLIQLLGQDCYVTLAEEFHITNVDCMKLAISKLLGLGIVLGGSIVKIPQIITILRHHSAQGLSLTSFLLETIAYEIVLLYNVRLSNPFSTFGEVFFMTLQNVLISLLIVYYNKGENNKNIGLILGGFCFLIFFLYVIPHWLMSILYAIQIPIGLTSKIPQITTNYKNQSTGQLSVFAVLNYFAGTMARTFTTWVELDDFIMLFGNLLASFLNGILVLQLIIYWKNKSELIPSSTVTATAKVD